MKKNLIELWKGDCEECQLVKPTVKELEKEGYKFERYNIDEELGKKIWEKYAKEIDENSTRLGYEVGYIYTPTFINPITRKVIAYSNHPPSKKELIKLTQ